MSPLVSVICLCYNHERFVSEALLSVLNQTYKSIEIIVVDDSSSDNSRDIIERFIIEHPNTKYVSNRHNLGNCKSFNKGLKIASGKYIVDFATDDVMLPDRISKQVAAFEEFSENCAAIFTNAAYTDENSNFIRYHYKIRGKELLEKVPSGEIYKDVVRYNGYICTPTLMFKTAVLRALGGYDERLSYEDFDICLRISRFYELHYLNEVLTERRLVKGSHSRTALQKKNDTTWRICMKIYWLNKTEEENIALADFVKFNFRYCIFINDYKHVALYWKLLKCLKRQGFSNILLYTLSRLKLNFFPFYRIYIRLRFGYEVAR